MVLSIEKFKEIQNSIDNLNAGIKSETPKLSIIVPAYNTEKYVTKCLLSLLNQTLKEIEIIVINDGSYDDTEKIISLFANKDPRIVLINQNNEMQGAARNNGMKIAHGEYIGFVDSDDWVDLDYFEKLYTAVKKYDSDIGLATNVRIGNGKTKKRLNIEHETFAQSIQEKFDINKQWKDGCPTNKIYRREFLAEHSISFPKGVFCEDKLFTTQAIYYANGVAAVPNVYYYYYRNPNSTVNTKSKKHKRDMQVFKELARRQVLDFLKKNCAQIRDGDFWAIKKEYKIFNIKLLTIKESLKTEKFYLFGLILIAKVVHE